MPEKHSYKKKLDQTSNFWTFRKQTLLQINPFFCHFKPDNNFPEYQLFPHYLHWHQVAVKKDTQHITSSIMSSFHVLKVLFCQQFWVGAQIPKGHHCSPLPWSFFHQSDQVSWLLQQSEIWDLYKQNTYLFWKRGSMTQASTIPFFRGLWCFFMHCLCPSPPPCTGYPMNLLFVRK